MATQGPLFPGTVASTSVLPEDDQAWVNPGNVSANDGTESVITHANFDANAISHQLVTSNYGFTIPTNATIDGITVEIEKDIAAGAAVDNRVQLRDASGILVGANKATATAWPSSPTIVSYGGVADTWTASPTEAMVNDPAFGVVVSVKATGANTDIGVDFVRITVTYTEAAPEEHSGTLVGTGGGVLASTGEKAAASAVTGTGGGVIAYTYAIAESHFGSFTATGGGAAVLSAAKASMAALTATGAGIATSGATGAHAGTLAGTGAGIATAEVSGGRSGALTATGSGVATASAEAARLGAALMSGGGVLTSSHATGRFGTLAATGGGEASFQSGSQPEEHDGALTATGGGVLTTDATTTRLALLIATAGGSAAFGSSAGHFGSLIATGGGSITVTTSAPAPALPDIAVVTPAVDIILTPFPVAISLAAAQSLGIEVDPL